MTRRWSARMPDELLRLRNAAWWASNRRCTPADMDRWPPITERVLREIGAPQIIGRRECPRKP